MSHFSHRRGASDGQLKFDWLQDNRSGLLPLFKAAENRPIQGKPTEILISVSY